MKPSYFGDPSTFALVHCNYEKYSKVTKFPSTSAVAEQTSCRKNKHNPSHLFAVVWHESFTFLQIVLGSFYFWLIMKLKICLAAVWSMCFSASEGFQHRKRPENDPANLKAKYQSGLGRKTVPKFHCDHVLPLLRFSFYYCRVSLAYSIKVGDCCSILLVNKTTWCSLWQDCTATCV